MRTKAMTLAEQKAIIETIVLPGLANPLTSGGRFLRDWVFNNIKPTPYKMHKKLLRTLEENLLDRAEENNISKPELIACLHGLDLRLLIELVLEKIQNEAIQKRKNGGLSRGVD
jgi:hypothetical protein